MTALLELRDVVKHFPVRDALGRRAGAVHAVDGVSLSVAEGEVLAIVGESGCGKSTLGRVMLRLIEPDSGSVRFAGEDLASLSPSALRARRRDMQIIFQDPYGALNPRMAVEDIIAEPRVIHGAKSGAETRQKVTEMLDRVGLPNRALDRFPHEFSGGQRQRIGIARALILRPRFVVCDEAVSALDVSVQAQIVNLLQDLQRDMGLTYLFIAHDLSVVRHISDRVAVMYLGKIVEVAEKRVIYATPQHPYTRALIAAVPALHPSLRSRGKRENIVGDIPSALNPPSGCRFHTRCPHVMPICREAAPPLVETQPGHQVACHLTTQAQT
jgi:oligopeptide/dipeptide ABC transporter ATP-binding protein